ncbi:calphotin-like [Oncorhynchus tshawytscha]|uniref:calphotin-like n=1 Tax=Oncorhynchus tshawytscha TaxID=74940 RepID=UPI001C3D79DC|nr:calphotin-like [Oncorhynchus tshawytscha]
MEGVCLLIRVSVSQAGEDWTAPVVVRVTSGAPTAVTGASVKTRASVTPSRGRVCVQTGTKVGAAKSPVNLGTMARPAISSASVSTEPPAIIRLETASVLWDTLEPSVVSGVPVVVMDNSVIRAVPVRTEDPVITSVGSVPVPLDGWAQCVPSRAKWASMASTAARTVPALTVDCVTMSLVSASVPQVTVDGDARRSVRWGGMVLSAACVVTVRTVLSVTISTGRVSVTQALKDLIVRRGSVPQACTDSSVTSTVPVTPPTLSAVTPCQVSAAVQQDGRGSTATRPVHLVTTATDAGCHAAVPTGPTVTESLGPASVPLVTWEMTALLYVLRGYTVLVAPLPAPVITTPPAPPSMDPVAAEKVQYTPGDIANTTD